jgi:hypothetical protein
VKPAVIASFGAWAPGLDGEPAWREWARAPRAPGAEGAPDLGFVPAAQRRRFDPLTRAMFAAARACGDDASLANAATVFATRHGPFATTVSLLEELAAERPLSPTRFSHSVHNTHAGLFSIWAGNRQPSTSLAARGETFAHGFLEAACRLAREPGRPVLLVAGDEPTPAPLRALDPDACGLHAVALLLSAEGRGERVTLRLENGAGERPQSELPEALCFLHWWLSGEPELVLARAERTWIWSRT